MARITIEDCQRVVPSRFELVLLAAHRARQLASMSEQNVKARPERRTVTALREIANGSMDVTELRDNFIKTLQTITPDDDIAPEDELLQLDLKQLVRQAKEDGMSYDMAQRVDETSEEFV